MGDAVLAIVGDVDPAATAAVLEARLAGLEAAARRAPARLGEPPDWPTRARDKVLRREREQAHLVLGYPGLTLRDPRIDALEVMNTVLGGQSGRLFQALREEDGLVYQVDASSTEGLDAGHFAVYAATGQDKVPRALAAIERHLAEIIAAPPTEVELERAKAWLIGQHGIGLQRRARIASQIALSAVIGEAPGHYLDYPQRIARIRAKDVLEVARAVIVPSRRQMVVVAGRGVALRG
ncbi:MAG: insulinase family protein [Nannocystaceae bacterium]